MPETLPNDNNPDTVRQKRTVPHYARLDALRGIAILSVIVFHAFIIRPFSGPWWMRFIGQGDQGVGLFYIVSALTLTLSWQHRQQVDRAPAEAFWVRRFFRIAPVFYLMLLVSALVTRGNSTVVPPAMRGHIFTWPNLLTHLTFTFGWLPWYQNSWIGVEWSIGVEMTFYAFFPLIIRFLYPALRPWQWLTLGTVSALIWPWLFHHLWFGWPSWATAFPIWTFPAQFIWFGAGFAVVSMRLKPENIRWGVLWLLWALWMGWHGWTARTANLLWVLPNFLLVWLTWHNHPGVRWLTHNRILRFVGTRSYSLYLIHWIVLDLVTRLPWADPHDLSAFWLRLGAALTISLVLSDLSYRYIEKPGIRLGKAVISRSRWGAPPQQSQPAELPRRSYSS